MTGHSVPKGAIYHYSSRRRREVEIGPALRAEVERIVPLIRAMLQEGKLPTPVNDARCRHCSLKDACQPEVVAATERLNRLRADLFAVEEESCDSF
jgi:CRISPR-associated exonuclease Cas4